MFSLDIQQPDRPFPAPVFDAEGPVNAQEHRGSQHAGRSVWIRACTESASRRPPRASA